MALIPRWSCCRSALSHLWNYPHLYGDAGGVPGANLQLSSQRKSVTLSRRKRRLDAPSRDAALGAGLSKLMRSRRRSNSAAGVRFSGSAGESRTPWPSIVEIGVHGSRLFFRQLLERVHSTAPRLRRRGKLRWVCAPSRRVSEAGSNPTRRQIAQEETLTVLKLVHNVGIHGVCHISKSVRFCWILAKQACFPSAPPLAFAKASASKAFARRVSAVARRAKAGRYPAACVAASRPIQ